MHVNAVRLCEDESNTNLFCSNSITRRCLRALLVMLNPLSSGDIASFSTARQLTLKVTLSSQGYNWASYPGESSLEILLVSPKDNIFVAMLPF